MKVRMVTLWAEFRQATIKENLACYAEKKGRAVVKKTRINDEWLFQKENDTTWKKITLPHDAMLLEKRNPELVNGNASGFYPGGSYVYRRNLFGKEAYRDKTVLLEFEGVYMNSRVLLNGKEVGGWIYGYTNFYVDLSEELKIGADNELQVIVDNSKTPNSRWYSGSGIYRSVNLWTGEKNHIKPEGIRVTTVSCDPAVIEVEVEAEMTDEMVIVCEVKETGEKVTLEKGEKKQIAIPDGKLWSADHPNLYTLKATLRKETVILDEAEQTFGIRTLAWSAENGFQINGETV